MKLNNFFCQKVLNKLSWYAVIDFKIALFMALIINKGRDHWHQSARQGRFGASRLGLSPMCCSNQPHDTKCRAWLDQLQVYTWGNWTGWLPMMLRLISYENCKKFKPKPSYGGQLIFLGPCQHNPCSLNIFYIIPMITFVVNDKGDR